MTGVVRALAVLALAWAFGAMADVRAPADAHGFYLFPVGLVPVALLQVRGRAQQLVAAVAALGTAATLLLCGGSLASSLMYAAASVLAGFLSLRLIRDSQAVRPLHSENDWARVVMASGFGALTLSAAAALADGWEQTGATDVLVVAGFVNAFASFLIWLPLAIRRPRFTALAGPLERVLQWTALLLACSLVFSDSTYPPFAYVVFALLCWSAIRLSLFETLAQLLVVRIFATTLASHDLGPYAPSATGLDLAPDLEMLFVQLFLIACSLCVVALALTSARTRVETRREATHRAERVASARLSTVVEELEAERTLLEEMREVDKVKDSLVSTVSHELRTPITNIIGYSEMLDDGDYGNLSPDQRQAMIKIEDNSRRLLGLIDDLLTLSRLQSDQMRLAIAPVDLVDVVRHAEESVLPRLSGARLSLESDLSPGPVVVAADGEKIERVLVNLLSNAVKFTPAGGRITLRLLAGPAWAVLEVSDTGFGISPEDQARLFSQFFRTATAQERHIQGTGLGLSIVRSIVEAHGGHVEVSSVVDEGTTFRVHLPRWEREGPVPQR